MGKNTFMLKFDEPFKYGDTEYKELVFELDNLKGRDIIAAANETLFTKGAVVAAELDENIKSRLAAKAAKVSIDVTEALPASDYMRVTDKVRSFLLGINFQGKVLTATSDAKP